MEKTCDSNYGSVAHNQRKSALLVARRFFLVYLSAADILGARALLAVDNLEGHGIALFELVK